MDGRSDGVGAEQLHGGTYRRFLLEVTQRTAKLIAKYDLRTLNLYSSLTVVCLEFDIHVYANYGAIMQELLTLISLLRISVALLAFVWQVAGRGVRSRGA